MTFEIRNSAARSFAATAICVLSAASGLLGQGTLADYQRARGLQARAGNLVVNTPGAITWIGDSDRFWYPRLPNCIGWIHRELQDFDQAVQYDQQGLEVGREHHVLEAEANSLINLGIDFDHTGKSEETLSRFHEAESIFERDAWFRWRYNIRLQAGACEHWLAQGDPDRAGEYARRLLEVATTYQARKYIAVAHKLMAETALARGDLATAEAELKIAVEGLGEHPAPLVAWRVFAALGRMYSKSGNATSARDAFNRSAAVIKRIAAGIDDERLRATFLNASPVSEVLSFAETNSNQ